MPSKNRVEVMGYLGADPDARTTQGGKLVVSLSVATTETWKDASGEKKEKTEWHKVIVWPPQSEFCAKHLAKGSLVDVEGSLQTRNYEDKDGVNRYVTEIVARQVFLLDRKAAEQNPKSGGAQSGAATPSAPGKQSDFPF